MGKRHRLLALLAARTPLAFILSDPAPTVWRELPWRVPPPGAPPRRSAPQPPTRTPADHAAAWPRAGRRPGRPDPDRARRQGLPRRPRPPRAQRLRAQRQTDRQIDRTDEQTASSASSKTRATSRSPTSSPRSTPTAARWTATPRGSKGLSAPGDIGHAQSSLELVYELRAQRDGRNRRQDEHRARHRGAAQATGGDRAPDAEAARLRRPLRIGRAAGNRRRPGTRTGSTTPTCPKSDLPARAPNGSKKPTSPRRSAASAAPTGATTSGVHGLELTGVSINGTELTTEGAQRGGGRRSAGSRSRRCRTRANRPRTASRSRSRSTAATPLEGTIERNRCRRNGLDHDPLTPTPSRRSALEVEVEAGPGRARHRKQRSHLHGHLRIGATGCGSPTSARPEPSPRTRSARRPAARLRAAARRRRSRTRSSPVEEGDAERALVPIENSIEGSVRPTLDTLAFEAERGDDRRRARLPGRVHLIARRGVELERGRGGPLPPPAAGPVRALPARQPARRRTAQRQQHRGGGADGERVGAALGGARGAGGGGPLRLRDPARRGRGRGRQRHPLRLDRAAGDRARGAGERLEDLAGLLRARRGPPRGAGRRARRVLRARRST